ncbi:hypothetical protein NicSoilC12_35620 [Arthrobacter sp. NicSoilC12]|nr:hypothetical protein NicSoilC12_35620 [Arthrobacter sp. NicSoilC12]
MQVGDGVKAGGLNQPGGGQRVADPHLDPGALGGPDGWAGEDAVVARDGGVQSGQEMGLAELLGEGVPGERTGRVAAVEARLKGDQFRRAAEYSRIGNRHVLRCK